ncbi:MAG: 3'-5' exonuclease [Burkholderiaceae bacterium]
MPVSTSCSSCWSARARRSAAVGDDDQSIWWRGAALENLRRLGEEFPQLRVIKLEQNYRSCQSILNAANALIGNNPKLHAKRLFSELGPGDPVNVTPCDSEEAEAESVVMRLQAMKFERLRFSDFAILPWQSPGGCWRRR